MGVGIKVVEGIEVEHCNMTNFKRDVIVIIEEQKGGSGGREVAGGTVENERDK